MKAIVQTVCNRAAVWPVAPPPTTEQLVQRDWDWTSELAQDSPVVAPGYDRSTTRPLLRVVGLLAFVQSLVFMAIWLLVCAAAGATTPEPVKSNSLTAELKLSAYQPSKTRDPFLPVNSATDSATQVSVEVGEGSFQLEGILYSPNQPAAVINGKLVTLHKNVALPVGNADVPVRATEITRDRVRILVQEQTIELRLPAPVSAPKSKPNDRP